MPDYTTQAQVKEIGGAKNSALRVVVHVVRDGESVPQLGFQRVYSSVTDDSQIIDDVSARLNERIRAYEDRIAKEELAQRAAALEVALSDMGIET